MNLVSIIIAIIIFSLIIIFHELGHFLLAKLNGIRVNEFCLGLGPKLVGFTKGETTYSINLLPFGGACVMEGEDSSSEDERAFNNKSVWARMSVVAAGPIFNFIMAFVLSIIVVGSIGFSDTTLSGVVEGSAAQEAGLQAGDSIVSINGKSMHLFKEVSFYIFVNEGEDLNIVYERDGKEQSVVVVPAYDEEQERYLIGITGSSYKKGNVLQVLQYSAYEVKYYIDTTITSLKMLATRKVSVNEMSGPVGIVSTISNTYQETQSDGAFYVFLNMCVLCILLSANLGVMNLLPIPALDGGRLVLLIIEAIRHKKFDQNKEGILNYVFLVLLLLLMVVIMFNDIRKIFF